MSDNTSSQQPPASSSSPPTSNPSSASAFEAQAYLSSARSQLNSQDRGNGNGSNRAFSTPLSSSFSQTAGGSSQRGRLNSAGSAASYASSSGHGGGIAGGANRSNRSLRSDDGTTPPLPPLQLQSQPQRPTHFSSLSMRRRSNNSAAGSSRSLQQQQQWMSAAGEDPSDHGGGAVSRILEEGEDEEPQQHGRSLSPTTAFLHQQFLSSATQHEHEAKALLSHVMEQAKQAKSQRQLELQQQQHQAPTQSHRRMPSRNTAAAMPYSIRHLVAVEEEGGDPTRPILSSPTPKVDDKPAVNPPPSSSSNYESPPPSPSRDSSSLGDSSGELSPIEFLHRTTPSLADTTQYVMALHQEEELQKQMKAAAAAAGQQQPQQHHRKKNSRLPAFFPNWQQDDGAADSSSTPSPVVALGDFSTRNDDEEEDVPVEMIHPADRMYAAATVMKAAARFHKMASLAKLKEQKQQQSQRLKQQQQQQQSQRFQQGTPSPTDTHSPASATHNNKPDGEEDPTILIHEVDQDPATTAAKDDVEHGGGGGIGTTTPHSSTSPHHHLPSHPEEEDDGYDSGTAGGSVMDETASVDAPSPHPRPSGGGGSQYSSGGSSAGGGSGKRSKRHSRRRSSAATKQRRAKFLQALTMVRQEWNSLNEFFQPQRKNTTHQLWIVLWAVVIPCLAAAVILFYFVDNPPTGRCPKDRPEELGPCGVDDQGNPTTSISWWLLFLGVRQVITWLLARGTDVFISDWLVLQHPRLIRLIGPRISLIVIQSKGWPAVLLWWAIWDIMILNGKGEFNRHWLYWQDEIKVFTAENPSGEIPTSEVYSDVLITMFVVAIAVSIKRYFLGLHLGRRLYLRFNDRLILIMGEVALISELALWARRKRDKRQTFTVWSQLNDAAEAEQRASVPRGGGKRGGARRWSYLGSNPGGGGTNKKSAVVPPTTSTTTPAPLQPSYETLSYKKGMEQWEEPVRAQTEEVHASKIVQFRQALALTTKPFFFSSAFGPVETREQCIKSADRLFRRLMKLFEEEETVDVNNLTRWMFKGCHLPGQKEKAAHLMLLLNPDVNSRLNVVDFVKGIDKIYQRLRLLENAVDNASQIDRQYEKILNYVFYFILGCVGLAILQLDPLTLLLTVSGLLVAISFMIGPGLAAFFEGLMMILVRQPYDIGDDIAIAGVNDGVDFDGAVHWLVEDINLFSTTARLVYTNEVASFSNGSLARCRLVNMNRSPNPLIFVFVKFQTDVPFSTIKIFKTALQKYVEDRPQEWVELIDFRVCRVEAQLNFVEYIAILIHRLSWQQFIPVKESKSACSSFCVELQRQLGCHYNAPPMPVEITMDRSLPQFLKVESMENLMETAKQFPAKKMD